MTERERKARILVAHQDALNRGETELRHVYTRWSEAKAEAYRICRQICAEKNGYFFAIISHNQNKFTAGFYYDEVDETTGEVKEMFCRIYPDYKCYGCVCINTESFEV